MTLFSTFLRAMILATCLAACLIEQPSINLLNIYINDNNGNNNNNYDVIVQNMQFATLSYIMLFCKGKYCFVSFAGNGTIKISFSFSCSYGDSLRPSNRHGTAREGGCVYVCICVIASMCVRIKGMRPSPNDDVNIMKARARYFSPQGSDVLHTNPPVS